MHRTSYSVVHSDEYADCHPRGRGDQTGRASSWSCWPGPSPRAWGAVAANGGKPGDGPSPRRGEQGHADTATVEGPTPRMRGAKERRRLPAALAGAIPAIAGISCSSGAEARWRCATIPAGGEQTLVLLVDQREAGPSRRRREQSNSSYITRSSSGSSPQARGAGPPVVQVNVAGGRSPRVRGAVRGCRPRLVCVRTIPAGAGGPAPSCMVTRQATEVSPRARGAVHDHVGRAV